MLVHIEVDLAQDQIATGHHHYYIVPQRARKSRGNNKSRECIASSTDWPGEKGLFRVSGRGSLVQTTCVHLGHFVNGL
jgi:hypothetical protein